MSQSFKKVLLKSWSVVALLALSSGAFAQSALQTAASQLQPGQWVQFQTSGFNSALLSYPSNRSALEYAESLKWDPVLKQMHFVGGGHYEATKHLVYSESSNSWESRAVPGGFFSVPNHGYDHIGLNLATRTLYHRQFNSPRIDSYDLDSRTWTKGASFTSINPSYQVAAGVEWFPELGRVIYQDGDWGLLFYDPANNSWSKKSGPLASTGPYHNFAEYSPRHKIVITGGGNGSRAIYQIDQTGNVTRKSDAPIALGITESMFILEPVSGNFLVFHDNGAYLYDPIADSWTSLPKPPFLTAGLDNGVFNSVVGYIPEYGVIMVGKFNFDNSKVFLYKHGASSGPPVTQPTVNLAANPTTVNAQGSTALTWSTSNADSCTASGAPWSGNKATSGNETVGPIASNTTFRLTCSNSGGGSASRSVTVNVTQPTPAPTVELNANPTQVPTNGTATLDWTTTNATSCTASGAWSGSKQTNGSQNVGPLSQTSTYTLTCTGAGGSASDPVTITVTAPPASPTVTISASPTSVVSGGSTQLSWSTSNATSCTASGGWAGAKATGGNETISGLTQNRTYTLTCSGDGGSITGSASVTVTQPPAPAPTVSLVANPTTVSSGSTSRLVWSSTNASSCVASGGWSGNKAAGGGNQIIGPLTANTAYMLVCTGSGGSTTASAAVSVTPPASAPPPVSAPTITIAASPSTIGAGETTTLTWSASNATNCTAGSGWTGVKSTSGSAQVGPISTSTTYTLSCTGAGGTGVGAVEVGFRPPQAPEPPPEAPPTVAPTAAAPSLQFESSSTSVVEGSAGLLSWSSANAASCLADGEWQGTKPMTGTETTKPLLETSTFKLTCSGDAGTVSQTISVVVTSAKTGEIIPEKTGGAGSMEQLSLLGLLLLLLGRLATYLRGVTIRRAVAAGTLVLLAPLVHAQSNALADYQSRASGPGVIRAISFDSAADVSTYAFPDGNFQASGSGWDQSVKASGAGSLRFNLPGNSGSSVGGSWRINFSDDLQTQFDAGGEFYVQWRQRFDTTMVTTNYQGSGGFKQIIIGEGDRPGTPEVGSCSEMEIVAQNTSQRGFPQMYHSCVSYRPFEEPYGGSDFKFQNAMPAPYCLYTQQSSGQITPKPGCFPYAPNEWITFQIRVKLGPRGSAPSPIENSGNITGFTSSVVQMWAAREGQPAQLIHDWSGLVLRETAGRKYGKLWLLPYMTGKNSGQSHATGYTWYDELIISRQRIADPGAAPSTAPTVSLQANPTQVNAQGSTNLTWSSTNANSCTASGGSWSGSKATSGSETVGPIAATTNFTLVCRNAGGEEGSATMQVTVTQAQPAPTVTLAANPSNIASGATTQLTWTSTNATSCSASGGWSGSKATSGSQSVGPFSANTSFALTCTGSGGSDSASTAITVAPRPTVSIAANPASVTAGGSATVTWTSTGATACTASGAWSGGKATSGSQQVGPLSANSTFALACSGAGGSQTSSATVQVTQPPAPTPTPAPTVTINANPATVTSGGSTTVTWSSTGATSCTASGGWSGSKATSGSQQVGPLTSNSTLSLACNGPGGSATNAATVLVSQPPAPTPTPTPTPTPPLPTPTPTPTPTPGQMPTVDLTASSNVVLQGETATLNWRSTDATSCTATGSWSGSKSVAGSETVGPLSASANYTLTCVNARGSATSGVAINVQAPRQAQGVPSTTPVAGGTGSLGLGSLIALCLVGLRRRLMIALAAGS